MTTVALVVCVVCDFSVPRLLPDLGHPSFRRREAAHRRIAVMGRAALPPLEKAARSHPSPEVRRRCQSLLAPHAVYLADRDARQYLPPGWSRWPWLGSTHWSLDYSTTQRFLEAACKGREGGCGTAADGWPAYREATRLMVRSMVIQRRPPDEIRRWVADFADEERNWIAENGKNYLPPVTLARGSQ